MNLQTTTNVMPSFMLHGWQMTPPSTGNHQTVGFARLAGRRGLSCGGGAGALIYHDRTLQRLRTTESSPGNALERGNSGKHACAPQHDRSATD